MAVFTKYNGQTLVFQPLAPLFDFFEPAAYYAECPAVYAHFNFAPVVAIAPNWFYHRAALVLSPYQDVHYEPVRDEEWERRTRQLAKPVQRRDWERLRPFWWTW